MANREIYLDHLASTHADPAVLAAMQPWLKVAGNPHARNRAGWRAAKAIEMAQAEVAGLIGATPGEIVFTSGATEANNLALLGAVPDGWPVIVSAIEHPSVLNCLPVLEARGHRNSLLPIDGHGFIDLNCLERMLAAGPAFVSVMAGNNEIGTRQPLAEIAALCRRYRAILHVDAAQALAFGPPDVAALGIDLLSLSGHKIYGPMGIGALYVRDGTQLSPMFFGGGQQAGRRPGTVPVAFAVGLGTACRLAGQRGAADAERMWTLRERLHDGLAAAIPGLRRNSPAERCLPGCLNISIPGADAADLLLDLPDIALSTGAACAGGGPSHVLAAIGLSDEEAHGSIRFGLGRATTEAEIDTTVTELADAVKMAEVIRAVARTAASGAF
jgi:cysteine desulfurase